MGYGASISDSHGKYVSQISIAKEDSSPKVNTTFTLWFLFWSFPPTSAYILQNEIAAIDVETVSWCIQG